jgi:serine/threonine-protein kinase
MTPEHWRQLEELYDAMKDLSPAERAVRLKDADPELRSAAEAIFAQDGSALEHPAWEGRASLLQTGTIVKAGMQLGPYKIERQIGAGGMGEVYRATDTRLAREVAIKTCRQEFGERFQREARAIASLNHRHICSLYDVGPNYLVMELLEGETLAEKLKRGQLSIEQTLLHGGEIADALAAAHAKGVVHRDMKPGNIMITKAGVKVLDFGLAKSSQDENLTGPNVVMGTPAYMAPEQREGQECDTRTDIYALGLMLHEMATGKRCLKGEKPSLEQVPEKLGHVIERCLALDPEDRWQSAADVRSELLWAAKPVQAPEKAIVAEHPNPGVETIEKRHRWPWILVAALALAAGVAAWAPWRHDSAMRIGEPLVRIDADLGTGVSLFTENGPALAISHDGTRVAFSSRTGDGSMRLYWRRLDQATATALPGTDSAFSPFFSPNGEQIAFFADGSLKKVQLDTGNVTVLANTANPAGGTWGEDGVIVFNRAPSLDLWKVAANGGSLSQIPRPAGQSQRRYWPQLLSGGKVLLVTSFRGLANADQGSVQTLSLEDGQSRTLVDGAHFGRYLSSGHLAYLRHGTLFVRTFDATRQQVTGPEVPILQGIEYSLDGAGQFDIAANGTLIYRAARAGSELKTVQWMDSTGRLEPLLGTPGDYRAISLSRDGKRLAIAIADAGGGDLYVYDIERHQQPARLTVGANINRGLGAGGTGLAWNSDGRYLFFTAAGTVWWVPTEGLSKPREFAKTADVSTVSHDGTRLFVVTSTPETRGDASIIPLSVGRDGPQAGHPEPLLHEPFSENPYDDSPDGRWLSYASDETGIAQTYVIEVANPARKWMVSSFSGHRAFWSPSGREIFFVTFFAPLRIMVTSFSLEGGIFHPDQPRPWSPVAIPIRAGQGMSSIAMAPDGKRFAVLMPAEQPLGNRVTFVMNFFDEVRRRTAPGK